MREQANGKRRVRERANGKKIKQDYEKPKICLTFHMLFGRLFQSFVAAFPKDLAPVICVVKLKLGVMTVKKTTKECMHICWQRKHNQKV